MTSTLAAPARIGAPHIAALGAVLLLAACSGDPPPTTAPDAAGSGGTQAGAGMSSSGASGSGALSGAGSGGTGTAAGGAGTGGGGGTTGGSAGSVNGGSGGTNAGAGGVNTGGMSDGGASATGGATNGGMSGMGGSASGSPSTGGAGAGGANSSAGAAGQLLSFEADIWPVFEQIRDPVFVYYDSSTYESCVTAGVCHGGDRPGSGLSFATSDIAYQMLLDQPSSSSLCDGTVRVVPGNPEESCLILFYEGRLRDELEWVDTPEIDLAREWVRQGALP